MTPDFQQLEWDELTADDCRQIIRLAVREDLGRGLDLTTVSLIPREARGEANLVVRRPGIVAGLRAIPVVLEEMQLDLQWHSDVSDGTTIGPATPIARVSGSARDLLTAERIMLNLLGRLSGVATLTGRYVAAVAGTRARVYDTRKTTPGWRRLEKYAVRCGGGCNHRTGLFDAILIKDNHLAQAASSQGSTRLTPADALLKAREFLSQFFPGPNAPRVPVEIEVDTIDQLMEVLPLAPDIILLDNMSPEQLRNAVALRDRSGIDCELEASGGIDLTTIRSVAETGVNRISVGALTHSATALDVALDWTIPESL